MVDIAERLLRLHREEGPITTVPDTVRDQEAVLLGTPTAVQHVLEHHSDRYRKARGYREELAAVFGRGLLTSEGEQWAAQHRVIRPLFTSQSIRSYDSVVTAATDETLERWEELAGTGETIDLLEEMEWLTLVIIGRAMFSRDLDGHAAEIRDALRVMRRAFRQRTDPDGTIGPELLMDATTARSTLERVVRTIVSERRESGAEGDDLVGRLLAAESDASIENDSFVRDQVMTFLLAGHETTAAALTWTWYLLATHPGHHRNLHDHAVDVGADGAADLPDLGPIKRTVQEAMRLYPPVPVFSREAVVDDEVDGHQIDAGTQVLLSQYVLHRDPTLWEEPTTFRPDRFRADDRPPYSYFPFGGGPRMCIGREFSLLESQLVLARALERFELVLESPGPDEAVGVNSAVTMVPADPLELRIDHWGT